MPEPTPAEIIPQVIIRERIPAAPVPRSAGELAKKIGQKVDEGNFREGLELAKRGPAEKRNIAQKAEQIGIERDPVTGAKNRTPEEAVRFNEYNNAVNLTNKFLEKGYDGMSGLEQTNLQKAVLEKLRLNPTLADEMRLLGPAKQKALAERYLKDPNFSGKVKDILDQALDPENKMIDEKTINDTADNVKEKEYERDDKQLEIDDVNRRITAVDRQLDDFARPGAGAAMGAKATEMETLRANLPTVKAELGTFQTQLEDTQFRLGQLQQERQATLRPGTTGRSLADIDAEIDSERIKLKNVQGEVQKREVDIQRLPNLEEEEKNLEEKKKNLSSEQRERKTEMNRIELELQKRQRLLAEAKSVRESQEQDLVDGMKNIFSEATGQIVDAQVQTALGEYTTELENLKQQTADQNEKAMYDALREKWLGAERRSKGFLRLGREKVYRPIDRTKVNEDFSLFIKEDGGPDAVMKQLLKTRTNSATGTNYTDTEADAILANKDYTAKMQPEVVKQLLARRMLVGKMNPDDVHIIVNAPWGKDMINQAIESNEMFRDEVAKVMGADALEKHGFTEKFAQEFKKHPLWLALLLGIPIGIGALGAATSTELGKT